MNRQRRRTTPDKVIQVLIERVPELFRVHKMILFGSRAAGESGPESDYDFLIVAETELRPPERAALVYRALRDVFAPMDILVVTPEEYLSRSRWKGTVIHTAAERGRVLYDAA